MISPEELRETLLNSMIENIFTETGSELMLESDESAAQIKLVYKDRAWFRYKLRDRRFDGPGWQPSLLTDWSYGSLDDKFTLSSAVEESVYCLDPRYPLSDQFSKEQADFIINPFEALFFSNPLKDNLVAWLRKWEEIFVLDEPPFPGYFSLRNISGARKFIHASIVNFLKEKGYDYLTAVPTWWHTAQICQYLGFQYQYDCDKAIVDKLNTLLSVHSVSRSKLSWIVMLQFWAELVESTGLIPENIFQKDLIFRDEEGKLVTFPLSPQRNLWMMFKL